MGHRSQPDPAGGAYLDLHPAGRAALESAKESSSDRTLDDDNVARLPTSHGTLHPSGPSDTVERVDGLFRPAPCHRVSLDDQPAGHN
jgi:hypothetical protein